MTNKIKDYIKTLDTTSKDTLLYTLIEELIETETIRITIDNDSVHDIYWISSGESLIDKLTIEVDTTVIDEMNIPTTWLSRQVNANGERIWNTSHPKYAAAIKELTDWCDTHAKVLTVFDSKTNVYIESKGYNNFIEIAFALDESDT